MKRCIVHYITDVKKSFDHSLCVINSLLKKRKLLLYVTNLELYSQVLLRRGANSKQGTYLKLGVNLLTTEFTKFDWLKSILAMVKIFSS